MEGVASGISIRKNKRLRSLTLRPFICKQRGVPVHLVEHMRGVDPSRRAVLLATGGTRTAWELHVVLVVCQTSSRVVTRGKVDIGTERRGITIAVHITANQRVGTEGMAGEGNNEN